jgi:hypothetical protein
MTLLFRISARLGLAGGVLALAFTLPVDAQPPREDKAKDKAGAEFVFRRADTNSDGKLSREEFEKFIERGAAAKGKGKGKGEAIIKQLFDRFDENKDGVLSLDEFKKFAAQRGGGMEKGEKGRPKGEAVANAAFNDAPTAEQLAFFEKKIRPVLVDQCYSCHSESAKSIKAGLKLDTRVATRAGGETGPAIVPGEPDRSLLIKALRSNDDNTRMPPKNRLSDDVISDFAQWVKMGAPDPRTGDGKSAAKPEIDIEKGRQHWAYQPVKDCTPPAVNDANWAANDIDKFVRAAQEAKGVKPAPDADERTLLRRVFLDITGLPPTPEDVNAYASDTDPQKYAKLVDRLLASPQFGERWGRHWLDVARYGESTGKSVNFTYPHAWRYRDYVIQAFNADKPFDQFIREQLAGDLLPAKDELEKSEHAIAAGFLAIGTKSLNERNRLQFELDLVDEQIDVFSQAFLGITAACARCHDHKFDPIPTRDYYALAGIFRSTETCYGTINSIQARYATPLVPLPNSVPTGSAPLSKNERETLERQLKRLKSELEDQVKKIGEKESFLAANGVRNRIQIQLTESKLAQYEADGTPKRMAMSVREKGRVKDSPIYVRGEPEKPGDVVPRGSLQVITLAMEPIRQGSGRKELADWVASPKNPLTARVYANRIWQHLLGRGIVGTADNFGVSGQTPSHPELLDHLATWLVSHDWSTKQLIKYIVTSRTYRQSAKFDAANHEIDPDNVLLWRTVPTRLDAEVIRDAMLAVSGKLDPSPAQGSPVAGQSEGYAQQLLREAGRRNNLYDSNHRSVYLPVIRDNLPEAMSLFDAADPSLVAGERGNTTVPAQSLFLMNSPFVIQQAEATAERLRSMGGTDADRVRAAYRLYYGRLPKDQELKAATDFIANYSKNAKQRDAWTAFCQALFGSVEFLFRT